MPVPLPLPSPLSSNLSLPQIPDRISFPDPVPTLILHADTPVTRSVPTSGPPAFKRSVKCDRRAPVASLWRAPVAAAPPHARTELFLPYSPSPLGTDDCRVVPTPSSSRASPGSRAHESKSSVQGGVHEVGRALWCLFRFGPSPASVPCPRFSAVSCKGHDRTGS